MPITYVYDSEKNVIIETPTGIITLDEISDYLHHVGDNLEVPYGVIDICPFHDIEEFAIGPEDQWRIYDVMKNLGDKQKYDVIIFVANQPYHVGMARMLTQVIEGADASTDSEANKAGKARLVATNEEAYELAEKIHQEEV